MSTYELKRKPSDLEPSGYIYFFVVDKIYQLAATYKTDEEAKKWYDVCRKAYVEPIYKKLYSRMVNGVELYLQERKEVYVDPFDLTYYNRFYFYLWYGSEVKKNFTSYTPNAYNKTLAEAKKLYDEFEAPKDHNADLVTIVIEQTN